jgi:hypothetical protein
MGWLDNKLGNSQISSRLIMIFKIVRQRWRQPKDLGALGMQNYQQNMGIAQAQALGGAQVQAQEQQELSQNYQDFLNQQNYPYKQLGFMSDLIRGTPTSGGAATMYQAPPSAQSQTVGLLGGLGSLAGAYTASQPK